MSHTEKNPRARSHRRLKILLPVAVLVVAVFCAFVLVVTAPEVDVQVPEIPPRLVRVLEVATEDVTLDVGSQGTVLPRTDTSLSAEVSGRVQSVSPGFADGGLFRKGEVLLTIDPRDYELAVARAEAALIQAEVRVTREEAEARVAREEWEALGEGRGAPDPLVLREPQLAEARAGLAAAQASLDKARLDLERTSVRAPFAGRVRSKLADLGQTLMPGTPVARVYALDYVEVELPVPVYDLEFLDLDWSGSARHGPEVTLTARLGETERTWSARIVRTAGEIDAQTRMLNLIARVEDPLGKAAREAGAPLPVGLFVHARIAGKKAENVVVLPRGALREEGSRDAGRSGRVLVARDEHLYYREVEVLRLVGERAIVRSGLTDGERVCISPLETAMEGMPVRTLEVGSDRTPPPPGIEVTS